MKKVWIFILAIVLVVGAFVGVFFWGRATVKTEAKTEPTKGNTVYKVGCLQESYVQGESIVFEILATSDVKFTSLEFSVDNEEYETLSVKTGESKNLAEKDKLGSGKYFIRSEVKVIDTTELPVGWYPVVIRAFDANGSVYVLTTRPILVQITAAATANNSAVA